MRQRLFYFRNKKIKIEIYKIDYDIDGYLLVFSVENKYRILTFSSVDFYSELTEDIEEYLPNIKSKQTRRKLRELLIIATVLYHRYYRNFVDAEEICNCYLELRSKNLFKLHDNDCQIGFIDALCKQKKEGGDDFCKDFTELLQSYKSGELRKSYIWVKILSQNY